MKPACVDVSEVGCSGWFLNGMVGWQDITGEHAQVVVLELLKVGWGGQLIDVETSGDDEALQRGVFLSWDQMAQVWDRGSCLNRTGHCTLEGGCVGLHILC